MKNPGRKKRDGSDSASQRDPLSLLLEQLPIGVSLLDRDRKLVYVNPELENILQLSKKDLLRGAAGGRRYIRPDGTTMPTEEFASIHAIHDGRSVRDVETGIVKEDGGIIWTSVSAALSPLADEGVVITTVDITERKRMEEELRRSRDELDRRIIERTRDLAEAVKKLGAQASLLELSHDAIFDCALDGTILYWNQGAESMYGWSREEAVGRNSNELLRSRFALPQEKIMATLLESGRWEGELLQTDRWGKHLQTAGRWALKTDDQGRPQGILKINIDITERKTAEAEVLRLVKALEQTAEGILILDAEGEILHVNPAFENITGLRAVDILRSTYDDILRQTAKEEGLPQTIAEALHRSERWVGPMTRLKPDGSEYKLDVSISPVLDEAGQVGNFAVVERDVTSEVHLRDHVQQRQKMEALGTLAGGIAHDFNNILMPIVINTEMALMEEPDDGPRRRELRLVLEAAMRGKALVKQITTFARQKEPVKIVVELAPILKEGLQFLKASLPANILIVDSLEAGKSAILADATQIHQILMNLGNNAAHAMRDKGGTLKVSLSVIREGSKEAASVGNRRPAPFVRLSVIDSGEGMSPDVLDRAFDPFFTTKAPGEGTGLGLAVVHGIVENHGGAIRAASEAGKGTRIDIDFPLAQGSPEPPAPARMTPPRGRGCILFIDDEDINIRTIAPMLERLGYGVVGQTDPLKALELFRRRPQEFDLVITDQMMPQMTGEILIGELLRIRPGLPIILSTGFSEAMDEERARSLGARALLMKPYSIQEIGEKIRSVFKEGT
jgi:PAS domain S-box-containing protein